MTTAPATATASATRTRRGPGFLARLPIHLVIIFLIVIWLIPTIGLLVNSLRPPDEVTKSGWWTALFSPSQLTLDNYRFVLGQESITAGFINSLFISIPATIIPNEISTRAPTRLTSAPEAGAPNIITITIGISAIPARTGEKPSTFWR